MFGRSQSGPGGLSINTSSANAFSSNSSQPPPSAGKPAGSLFGSLTTSQPQQSTSASQPQQSSSLFGNLSQSQQSGGLFGSSNQAGSSQQQQGSSIFGGASTQGTAGGLFGSQQSKTQIGGGLFGSSNAQPSQSQQGGGIFGSLGRNKAQNQPQQAQSSLFGGFNSQNKISSPFGNTQNQQNQQQATIQQPPVPRLPQIGQQMQQQTVPGVKLSVNELRGTTRFNDLHEELQKVIENVDNFVLNQIKLQEDCLTVSPEIENTSSQMAPDVEYCTKSLETIQDALENDAESIAFAKNLVKADAANAKLSFRAIQNLKQPSQFHQTDLWTMSTSSYSQGPSFSDQTAEEGVSRNIVEYFSKQAEEMARTLDTYKRNIMEVETYLKSVESNTMQQMQQMMFSRARDGEKSAEDQVRELAAVLRDFEAGIMGVAAKVGSAREQVQEVMLGLTEAVGTRTKRYGMP